MSQKRIVILAGEASGDALGAKLISALRQRMGETPMDFRGVGGERMAALGFTSLFPMHELSLIGFVEIIPHIPRLLRRLNETEAMIRAFKPDMVITIDAPGFNFRIAERFIDRNFTLVHYVAPTVWAYKPERAEKVARLYDHILVLLPFEPPYFTKAGIACTYIGHPVLEEKLQHGDGKAFRQKHGISAEAPLLILTPGSRRGELTRLTPIFRATLKILAAQFPNLQTLTLTTPSIKPRMEKHMRNWPVKNHFIADDKAGALAASKAALAKSGTNSLEIALGGVPMVIAYKVHPYSARMLRKMMQIPYVTLLNIVANAAIIPEFLQENCTAEQLAPALATLLQNTPQRQTQLAGIHQSLLKLGLDATPSPSEKAADAIAALLKK